MAYTPNNPYIPGDPYSYDLKWIVNQIKYAISLYEPLHDDFLSLSSDFAALHDYVMEYFRTLDLDDEISAKLETMYDDGSLAQLIEPLVAEVAIDLNNAIGTLNARMDTFEQLPSGSTSGDAELADIRVAYNGRTYSTAGASVRAQAEGLANVNAAPATQSIVGGSGQQQGGVVYTWNRNKVTISGTVTALSFSNITGTGAQTMPAGLTAGGSFYVDFDNSAVPEAAVHVFAYKNGTSIASGNKTFRTSGFYKIPSDATGLLIRLEISSLFVGAVINGTCTFNLLSEPSNATLRRQIEALGYVPWTPSGDTNTAAIQEALDSYGVALLGPYPYKINNIVMPAGSTIRGMGKKSELIYGTNAGAAIHMVERCTVEDLTLSGAEADIVLPDSVVSRYGIEISRRTVGQTTIDVYGATVRNVLIRRFNGMGIRLNNTGGIANTHAILEGVICTNCFVGLSIANVAEYNRVTGCTFIACKKGCVNNSGNNMFVNCNFSRNEISGLEIQSGSNNGHGTFSGCTFNHEGGNTGTAISVDEVTAGEIFEGCQIFYGNVIVTDSTGIRFVGCNFGRDISISASRNVVVAFDACQFSSGVAVSGSSNTRAVFNDCYRTDTGAIFAPII